jgi:hypothetical protein
VSDTSHRLTVCAVVVVATMGGSRIALLGQAPPARDTPARSGSPSTATGRVSGRVVAADTGRPVRRARVVLTTPQAPVRSALTDNAGGFQITGLPEGRYTLTASKIGFVTLAYGQRRPLQAGTPLQLGTGGDLRGIEIRLPRGSAISGHILDDTGEPMPGVSVRVLTYRYAQGIRQLVQAGSGQTDDRGEYRVWGLNPGEYYVSASAQNPNIEGRGAAPGDDPAAASYAPTYYPGVAAPTEARPISLGLGAEISAIDFNVLLLRTARVSGRVTNPDGSAARGNVQLVADGQRPSGRGGSPLGTYNGRVGADGRFAIVNVPPGRYTVHARGEVARVPQFASQPLLVADGDVSDVFLALAPPAVLSGIVMLEPADPAARQLLTQFQVTAPAAGIETPFPAGNARVDRDGNFTLDGIAAGSHLIRSAQTPRGWALKSVLIEGRDVIDSPLELQSGQTISDITLVFTNRLSEVNGTVTDRQGAALTNLTVLAFPQDASLWRPQARQIVTARPDQNGRFQMRGLPPGQYYVAAIDPIEQGEWFDPLLLEQHRIGAARLTLLEGEVKTENLTLSP